MSSVSITRGSFRKKGLLGTKSQGKLSQDSVVPQNHFTSRYFLQACLRGKHSQAKSLLDQNPSLDINHCNLAKETPLFFASASSAPLSCLLLDRGANPSLRAKGNRTVAHQLAILGDAEVWITFCKHDGFTKLLKKELKADLDGTHPLHLATKLGHLELVKEFPRKWDLDVRDLQGATPLICSIGSGNYEIALYLLSKNVKLGQSSSRYRSAEMSRDIKHTALHIMLVNEELRPADRMFKRVLRELIRQKAPTGCLYCSEGKGCTSVAKRRVTLYRKMKSSLKSDLKGSNLDLSENHMKLMILSMITHEEGSKGGLWRGLMKCGSKDFESFSRNLNFLFQKLDIEEEATRAVLVEEINSSKDPLVLIRERTVFTNLLLAYMHHEASSFLPYFSKVFCCECPSEMAPSPTALALRFFGNIKNTMTFFPSSLRALLQSTSQQIDSKFEGEFGDVFLKGNLFVRFISSVCSSSSYHTPSCSTSPQLLQETQLLIKKVVSGQSKCEKELTKHTREFDFIYERFWDPNFETSSSLLLLCSHRLPGQEEEGKKEEEVEEEEVGFGAFFSELLNRHQSFLEDAIMMRSKEAAKNELQFLRQLEAYFKQVQ